MSAEPENLVLELLRGIRADVASVRGEVASVRAEVASVRAEMATKAELRAEIHSLRADVASDFLAMQARTDAEFRSVRDQIAGLRQTVVEYHSAVVGHGVLIGELDTRMRRVERHLGLPILD